MAKAAASQIRVALWTPPRSLSTAFERCVSTLHEKHATRIFHEPFTTAYHLGPEQQLPSSVSITKFLTKEPGYSYSWVKSQLEADLQDKEIIFFKDLGYSIDGKYEHIPQGYQHTFLIRSPELVFTSMHDLLRRFPIRLFRVKMRKISPKGWVYEEMFNLYEHLTKELGHRVIILDAEDLVENPKAMLKQYCKETDIPYSDDMINWRPGDQDLRDWKYSKRLMRVNQVIGQYDRALSSSGLGKPNARTVDVSKYSEVCQEAIAHSEPFYRKLYEKRLRRPEEPIGN